MTNCKWAIDGDAIKKSVKVDTLVINDFLAVGYGIPTLAVDDPKQITRLPSTNGKFPAPAESTKIVVGAGTGLGVDSSPMKTEHTGRILPKAAIPVLPPLTRKPSS